MKKAFYIASGFITAVLMFISFVGGLFTYDHILLKNRESDSKRQSAYKSYRDYNKEY